MNYLSPSSCNVRPFARADRPALLTIINAVCGEGRWMKTSSYEPTPAWEHALSSPACTCHLLLVAGNEDWLIGWCRIFISPLSETGEIAIGLLAPYRDQGLGTQILQQALHWANRHKLKRLVATIRFDNQRALHVFNKLDFLATGRNDGPWVEMQYSQNQGETL